MSQKTLISASALAGAVAMAISGATFLASTDGASAAHRRKMAIKSILIATAVLLGFAYGGEWLLSALGVSLDAFRAAGGVLLFLLALDMIFEKRTERREDRAEKLSAESASAPEDISVFPMAIPMLAGPGAIASIMLYMSGSGGDIATQGVVLAAMAANLIVCLVLFLAAGPLMRHAVVPALSGLWRLVAGEAKAKAS